MVSWAALLLSCAFFSAPKVSGKANCEADQIGMATLTCQKERESLSDASGQNDLQQLCQALQSYSNCLGPKLSQCKGQAYTAFMTVMHQYEGTPYNCKLKKEWTSDVKVPRANNVNNQLHINANNHKMGSNNNNRATPLSQVTVKVLPKKTGIAKDRQTLEKITTTTKPLDHLNNDETTSSAQSSTSRLGIKLFLAISTLTYLTTLLFF